MRYYTTLRRTGFNWKIYFKVYWHRLFFRISIRTK